MSILLPLHCSTVYSIWLLVTVGALWQLCAAMISWVDHELSWLFTKRFRGFCLICRKKPNPSQNFCYSHSLNVVSKVENICFLSPLVLSKWEDLAFSVCIKVRLFFNFWMLKRTIMANKTQLWILSLKNWKKHNFLKKYKN